MIPSTVQNQYGTSSNTLGHLQSNPEYQLVNSIIESINPSSFTVDSVSVTNLFVGLKSKPLTLLVGPNNTGKIEMIQSLGKALMGGDPLRCQMMTGHSWWADRSENVVQFTEAQVVWNAGKVIELIQEANLPENMQRMYMACLTRISPGELTEFFSEVAYQLRHDRVMRVASYHLTKPLPFPRNMFLVGTMDENQFKWADEDLISETSLIHWAPDRSQPRDRSTEIINSFRGEKTFLKSCLRHEQSAFQKLKSILIDHKQALSPLFETANILQNHHIFIPSSTIHSAIVYLANSWSLNQTGLFNLETSTNLNIALDLAITQTYLLPIQDRLIESARLRKSLFRMFQDRFVRSSTFVASV